MCRAVRLLIEAAVINCLPVFMHVLKVFMISKIERDGQMLGVYT